MKTEIKEALETIHDMSELIINMQLKKKQE